MAIYPLNIKFEWNQNQLFFSCCIENDAVCELNFTTQNQGISDIKLNGVACELEKQLNEYFNGTRKVFNLPLNPRVTEFQQIILKELQKVPYGVTCSYKTLAEKINRATAYRAVAQALHRNPIPIIIPCHRVIGSNGKLVGYGGGLKLKERLLLLEKIV